MVPYAYAEGRLERCPETWLTVCMDIYTDSQRDHRLEIVDTGRRRRFSKEVKLRIVVSIQEVNKS